MAKKAYSYEEIGKIYIELQKESYKQMVADICIDAMNKGLYSLDEIKKHYD